MGRRRGTRESLERRELALSYIRIQRPDADSIRAIKEKWGVAQSTAERDVKRAWRHLADEGEAIDRPMRKHQLRSTVQSILLMAMQGKKLGSQAMQAAVVLGRLDGLFEPIQMNHSGSVESRVRHMTSDDQRQELARLMGYLAVDDEDEDNIPGDDGYNGGNGVSHH